MRWIWEVPSERKTMTKTMTELGGTGSEISIFLRFIICIKSLCIAANILSNLKKFQICCDTFQTVKVLETGQTGQTKSQK